MRDDKTPREGQGSQGLRQLDGDWPANWQLDLCKIKDIFLARCLFSGIFNKTWESPSRGRMPVRPGAAGQRRAPRYWWIYSSVEQMLCVQMIIYVFTSEGLMLSIFLPLYKSSIVCKHGRLCYSQLAVQIIFKTEFLISWNPQIRDTYLGYSSIPILTHSWICRKPKTTFILQKSELSC